MQNLLAAANIFDLMQHASVDMPTLEAFTLACDLVTEAQDDPDLSALDLLRDARALYDDGESDLNIHLLNDTEAMLTDPASFAFISDYCKARFVNS